MTIPDMGEALLPVALQHQLSIRARAAARDSERDGA